MGQTPDVANDRRRSIDPLQRLVDHLFAFGDDALNGFAGLALSPLANDFEHFLQAFDLALGFFFVLFKSLFQLRVGGRPGQVV